MMVNLHSQPDEFESPRRCISDSVCEGNHPERRCQLTGYGSGLNQEAERERERAKPCFLTQMQCDQMLLAPITGASLFNG